MTVYYTCDGSVTTVGNGANTGLKCSTGWQTSTTQNATLELTGELITYEQASGLISALLTIAAIYAVFKIMYRLLR